MINPNINFANPEYFFILLLIPVFTFCYFKKTKTPAIKISGYNLKSLKKTWRNRLKHLPFLFKILAFVFIVIAIARPRITQTSKETITEGIDIVIALDISTSMLAQDFKPNRFKAASKVGKEFIKGRKNDRIGMVVFAGESYTQCPLTTDYDILAELIDKIKMEQIEDGTAIGTALINSINRLRDSKAKSKVIILLSDGANNKGSIDPETAAEAAKALGIRIYTIGVGNKIAPYPFKSFNRTVLQNVEFNINEEMLSGIATMTKGKFFKAKNEEKLKQIYEEIDKLEKTKIKTKVYKRYTEKYRDFILFALFFLLTAILLDESVLKRTI